MIIINNKKFKIKDYRKDITAGYKHYTIKVHGFIPHSYDSKRFEISIRYTKTFTGIILRPVYHEDENYTIFWVYVEED